MCIASKYVNEIKTFSDRVRDEMHDLGKLLSKLDKELSEAYHKLEYSDFNASEGYYHAKHIQTILRKRRVVKEEFRKLKSICHSMNFNAVDELLGNAEKNLKRIHKQESEWKVNWKENYRVEDLQIH